MFTPGPWQYELGADGEHRIYAGVFPGAERACFDVADVWLPEKGDRDANGRLIAAAPDLYVALVQAKREMWIGARDAWTVEDFNNWAVVRTINAALERADGKPRGPKQKEPNHG